MATEAGPGTHYVVQNTHAAKDIGRICGDHRDPAPPKG
jgi:hypothetical protein